MELNTIVIKTTDGTIMSGDLCEELPEYFKISNGKIINKTGAPIPSSKVPEKRYEGRINIMKNQIIWWYIQE